jgi:hypothetical protein
VEDVLLDQDKSSRAEGGSSSRPCTSSVAQTNNERNSPPLKDLVQGVSVIVICQGMEFPGNVAAVNDNGAVVDCMEKISKCCKWPKDKDILFYKWCDTKKIIDVPKPFKRFYFSVSEL